MSTQRECDLCGLGCGKHPVGRQVGGSDRAFCCIGCMNVYLILWESGAIQSGHDIRENELYRRSLQLGLISNSSKAGSSEAATVAGASEELLLHVGGMWCTSCAWLIENALAALPGVVQAEASFASDLVKVRYRAQNVPPDRIMGRIHALGYTAQPHTADIDAADVERRDLLIRTGLAAFLWANVMSFSLVLYAGYFEQISRSVRRGLPFVLMGLATPVVFYCAQPVLQLAWRGLLNRAIRMEVLLAIGILAAYGYSVVQAFRGEIHLYFDTATVIVMLVLAGKLIERSAKERVAQWIAALHSMMPRKARLLARGEERFVSVQALEPGQVFVTKAGEQIPADGVVTDGESHTDESLLTGEATPIPKRKGDLVVAGSVNLDGPLHAEATRSARDSTLSRIIQQVELALGSRCDLERTVDRVSRVFVPCVVVIAVFTLLFTWLLGTASLGQALMRGITVLVIACPCALGLATPLTIMAAFGAACRRGILVRDSRVLETVRKVDTVILDKTGTVTEGKFTLIDLVCCEEYQEVAVLAGMQETIPRRASVLNRESSDRSDQILSIVASLEQYSEHPLGKAVTEIARLKGCALFDASSIEIHKGKGIRGMVCGHSVFAGSRRLMEELGTQIEERMDDRARQSEGAGKTVSFVGWDGRLQALAVFGDRVKPEAEHLVAELKSRGIEVRLISGDAAATTRWTASAIGIDHFESEILPEQKAEAVCRLQEGGAIVAMVGDGVNDAPALAQANLGIAMASGTDIAVKAAAVVLMNGSLRSVMDVFDLATQTMRVVRQNLFWAFFYNSVGISLAVAGVLNPIMAAIAMLLSSASVIGNSLRLVRRVG